MKPKGSTMEAVALKAGVSITTVSHVINRSRNVNQITKNAVLNAMRELNYKSIKMTQTKTDRVCIGVILADSREDYYYDMTKAIESVADEYGVSVIFCDSEANYEKEVKNIGTLLERNISGLLLAPADADRMPPALKKIQIPVVLIDRQYESHNFLIVGINNFRSSYLGTKHFIETGCRNIGFIGYSDPVDTIRQRILGYKAAMVETDYGVVPQVLYLKYNGGDSYPLINQFIMDGKFDGIITATSSLCYELITVLGDLDEGIQKNIKIITFDDNRWFDYLKYSVSVISQPVMEIANAALENLLQIIDHTSSSFGIKRELTFDTTIVDRPSVSHPAL
jgi:DNA-binding LacI/PurR family transcriptional regulator